MVKQSTLKASTIPGNCRVDRQNKWKEKEIKPGRKRSSTPSDDIMLVTGRLYDVPPPRHRDDPDYETHKPSPLSAEPAVHASAYKISPTL